jgi:hypothetical protein
MLAASNDQRQCSNLATCQSREAPYIEQSVDGIGRLMLPGLHRLRPSEALQRTLPLLVLIVALLGTWLQPPVAQAFGRDIEAPAFDTTDGIDRAAVKPKPPSLSQAQSKQRVATHGGAAPQPVAAASVDVAPAIHDSNLASPRLERIHVRAPRAILAQPRAPPSSRTLTPAA